MTLERHPGEWTFDSKAQAMYVSLKPGTGTKVDATLPVDAMVNLDIDEYGDVIGVEIIARWPARPEGQPGPCPSCEHCTQDGRGDCVKADHPRCPACAHCIARHAEQDAAWDDILSAMFDQVMRAEPGTRPPGIVDFKVHMTGRVKYRLTATTAQGQTITRERTLEP